MAEKPERAETPVNMRRALAGAALLEGMSQKQALMKGGFSESTARRPTANGLTAERCIEELKKIDPEAVPAKLLGLGRTRLLQHLQATDGATLRTGEIARLVDVMERAYGSGEPLDALDDLRGYRERQSFAEELARRVAGRIKPTQPKQSQLERLSPQENVIEAEVVDEVSASDAEKG